MKGMFYRLDENKIAVAITQEEWMASNILMSPDERRVDKTIVDDVTISTVFMSVNAQPGIEHPLLFETMIMGGNNDGVQEQYSTWDEAVAGHNLWVRRVAAGG